MYSFCLYSTHYRLTVLAFCIIMFVGFPIPFLMIISTLLLFLVTFKTTLYSNSRHGLTNEEPPHGSTVNELSLLWLLMTYYCTVGVSDKT